jgi:uncharacterized protein YbjT (DUF2867 family)
MAKILVVGGTGMLGRPVVVTLHADGFEVRVFTTNLDNARSYFGDHVEYAEGDVGERQSLINAMQGCEYVYINLRGGPSKKDFVRIELDGSKNIYTAAKETGMKKIVKISGALAVEKNIGYYFIKPKIEAEKALTDSGLTYVILRPSWFCESLPLFVQGSKVVYVGSGKTQFHFLASADYAAIVSQCFKDKRADNKILDVFGPESMPIPEALRCFLSIVYPDVTINRVPVWLAKWSALFAFNRNLRMAVNLMSFFDKHDDAEAIGNHKEADVLFGPCKTTVEEYARMYKKIVKG